MRACARIGSCCSRASAPRCIWWRISRRLRDSGPVYGGGGRAAMERAGAASAPSASLIFISLSTSPVNGGGTCAASSPILFRRRVDHLADFGDLRRRKAAHLRVLPDDRLVLRQIGAEGLVRGDITFLPLDVRAELRQHLVRFGGRRLQLFAFEGTHGGNVAFDDEFAQGHGGLRGSIAGLTLAPGPKQVSIIEDIPPRGMTIRPPIWDNGAKRCGGATWRSGFMRSAMARPTARRR